MNKRYITYEEYGEYMNTLVAKIDEKFDGIIGITRGGLPIATHLSHHLHMRDLQTVTAKSYSDDHQQSELLLDQNTLKYIDTSKKYLIVDDICDTGETLKAFQKIFPKSKTCTLFLGFKKGHIPDYYVEITDEWIVFPWETN